jgi:hypothetical protein
VALGAARTGLPTGSIGRKGVSLGQLFVPLFFVRPAVAVTLCSPDAVVHSSPSEEERAGQRGGDAERHRQLFGPAEGAPAPSPGARRRIDAPAPDLAAPELVAPELAAPELAGACDPPSDGTAGAGGGPIEAAEK